MSGHSKWHNIQKTKGAADAKRSAAFTKIAKEIIVAVKEGGGSGDPNNNSRLATVIAKAKAVNMPNDNIKRTIDRALGSGSTDNYEAVTYEGYGPGGVAVIVEALTDNRQRTAPEVRHAFDKCNGNLGAQGCVSWSFDKKGVIVIDNEEGELDEDTVMMDALEAGAADFEADGPALEITCDPDAFNDVVKALEAKVERLAQDWETLKAQFQGEPFYDEAERELFATLDLGAAITAAHEADEERRRIAELKAAMEPEPVEEPEPEPEAVPEPAECQPAEFPQPLEQMPEPQPAPMPAPVPPAPPAPAPVAMAGDPWTVVVPCATREQMQGVAAALKAQGVVGTIMHGTVGQVYERMNGGY